MGSNYITIGFVTKLRIEDIPIVEKFIEDRGMLIFSKISAGRLILEESLPSGGVYEEQEE